MLNREKSYLFLVVLGGKAKKANVELHDVRWVIGSKIEDTYEVLRRDWFGSREGLHIDSFKKINYIDGYKINLKNIENEKSNNNVFISRNIPKMNLWFVNIGGYDPNSMQEKHEFGLVVAKSPLEAKNKAKSKWLNGCQKKHKDDITSLKKFILDDCELIQRIGNWEIELILENNFVEETNSPDWFGYMRID
tara:strand:- start:168 stop:743 length:576 start_codon:yes stop_codon:yes gene_type:complete